MNGQPGLFLITLDFELYWGMKDKISLEDYQDNLLGVRSAVPRMLMLFDAHRIHVTWAVVGFLFFESLAELKTGLPVRQPGYVNGRLSPYRTLDQLGENEAVDPFHYASSLIKMIMSYPNQEVGTHTFSHYYCLEDGQDVEEFKADLAAAREAAGRYGINLKSLVFPRDQVNPSYLSICWKNGIRSYRGNPTSWFYTRKNGVKVSFTKRFLSFLDNYINLGGYNCYPLVLESDDLPLNLPYSRCLRPYSPRFRLLEPLRLRRILSEMTHAAQNGLMYHLYWHPHNFGINQKENLSFLDSIIKHFTRLNRKYSMESLTMGEVAERMAQR